MIRIPAKDHPTVVLAYLAPDDRDDGESPWMLRTRLGGEGSKRTDSGFRTQTAALDALGEAIRDFLRKASRVDASFRGKSGKWQRATYRKGKDGTITKEDQ